MVADSPTDIRAFYEKHHREAYRVARARLKNREDALDAVQDAFVNVVRATARLGEQPMTLPWLCRIVTNVCIDRQRKRWREPTALLDDTDASHLEAPQSHAFEPAAAFEARQLRAAIGAGIDALPAQHRTVLVMRELRGMTYEQIARGMKCPPGTVMSRLFHARRKLRRSIGEALELSEGAAAAAA